MQNLAIGSLLLLVACSSQTDPKASDAGKSDSAATDTSGSHSSSTSHAASATSTANAAPSSAGTASASAPLETRTLTIDPDELRVDGAVVVFEPGSRVQRASYDVYRFDKAAFEQKLGKGKLEKSVKVTVEIVSSKEKNASTADPNAPAPQGGIRVTTYEARVVSVP